jgi:hypothetical protein
MNSHVGSNSHPDMLDELITQVLVCGGVLSQIISHMVEAQASGRSAPDAAPIPEVAHSLIRGVIADVAPLHSDEEITTTTAIIEEITNAISENIFLVPPSGLNGG